MVYGKTVRNAYFYFELDLNASVVDVKIWRKFTDWKHPKTTIFYIINGSNRIIHDSGVYVPLNGNKCDGDA